MSFPDAVRTCLTQRYVDFKGRALRSEFWFFLLFWIIVHVVAQGIDRAINNGSPYAGGVVSVVTWLALLPPLLSVGARRLHDVGRSGWWWLLYLTVIGAIVLIAFWLTDSSADNQYGPTLRCEHGESGAGQVEPAPRPGR